MCASTLRLLFPKSTTDKLGVHVSVLVLYGSLSWNKTACMPTGTDNPFASSQRAAQRTNIISVNIWPTAIALPHMSVFTGVAAHTRNKVIKRML